MARRGAGPFQVTILGQPRPPPGPPSPHYCVHDHEHVQSIGFWFLEDKYFNLSLCYLIYQIFRDRKLTDPPNPSPSELITLFFHAIT